MYVCKFFKFIYLLEFMAYKNKSQRMKCKSQRPILKLDGVTDADLENSLYSFGHSEKRLS